MSILFTGFLFGVSQDCPDIINMALGLRMDVKQPARMTSLRNDCCYAPGIICISSSVNRIDWSYFNLDGNITGAVLPSTLKYLKLNDNPITGVLPQLPTGLLELDVHNCKMGGDVPAMPDSLTHLYLGFPGIPGNHFTGSVILKKPSWVYINDNWITDIIIQDISVLYGCELRNNPLLGNPNLTPLTMCTKTELYSANLLPITMFTRTTTLKVTTTTSAAGITSTSSVATSTVSTLRSTAKATSDSMSTTNTISQVLTSLCPSSLCPSTSLSVTFSTIPLSIEVLMSTAVSNTTYPDNSTIESTLYPVVSIYSISGIL